MDKWGIDKIIKFLEKYSELECLWNISSSEYRSRDCRAAALRKLACFMNIDGFDYKAADKKIQVLRTAYMNEKRKVEDSKKSGAGTSEIYTPKLKWYALADNFLKNSISTRKSLSSLVSILFKI